MPKLAAAVPSSQRRRRWKIADARPILATLVASGLSLGEFARREGLEAQRLRRWQRRLAREAPPARPTRPAKPASAPELIEIRPRRAEPIEIVLASGRVLRVTETVDVAVLARLVAALEHGC